ncbi:MAG: TetR/AcrR family transcriptional regulator [Actinomycetota bacterium]|jgi:AcrR family transcriptional regulator
MRQERGEPAAPGTQTDARVERTRAVVLAAARNLLLEEGWDAVTHLRVAAASGVARATVYRHWPSCADLLHDVLRREAEMSHSRPSGRLRPDLVAEADALRRQLGTPALAGVLAVLMERSLHDPELARVKRSVVAEISRVLRQCLRDGIADGDLPAALDVNLAVAQLLGPLLYRRLMSAERFNPAVVAAVVDSFLSSPVLPWKPTPKPGRRDRSEKT